MHLADLRPYLSFQYSVPNPLTECRHWVNHLWMNELMRLGSGEDSRDHRNEFLKGHVPWVIQAESSRDIAVLTLVPGSKRVYTVCQREKAAGTSAWALFQCRRALATSKRVTTVKLPCLHFSLFMCGMHVHMCGAQMYVWMPVSMCVEDWHRFWEPPQIALLFTHWRRASQWDLQLCWCA